MSEEIQRFAGLLGRIASDQAFGGLRDLLQALSEERARRFVNWLSDATQERQVTAELAIRDLVNHPKGEAILRCVAREVVFGTETISLAALALIASEATVYPEDQFYSRAARTLEGMPNDDILAFLSLLRNLEDLHIHFEWRPVASIDLKCIRGDRWRDISAVLGIGEEEVHAGITSAIRRGLVLADEGGGRLAGDDEYAVTIFLFAHNTWRYFQLLAKAVEIAEPAAFSVLAPMDVKRVERCCKHVGASNQ